MNQYSGFFTALKKLPGLSKEEAVYDFTNGRTNSLRKLTVWEVQELTRRLGDLPPARKELKGLQVEKLKCDDDGCNKMRRHIIAMAHEMGWKLPNGKADMERINAWSKQQFGKCHLNGYAYKDLTKLVSIFKSKVYGQFLQKV